MLRILIDANMYLSLYRGQRIQELRPTLVQDMKPHLFITAQIVDEVERNKLTTARDYLCGFAKTSEPKIVLPELLFIGVPEDQRSAKNRLQELQQDFKNLQDMVAELTESTLTAIGESNDAISTDLRDLFSAAKPPSDTQIERARARKEFGNPPGKAKDPLGDQISWEQLLDEVSTDDEIWIVSSDPDLVCEVSKTCVLLHAPLAKQIRDRGGARPKAFTALADAADAFQRVRPAESRNVPSAEKLESIKQEEEAGRLLVGRSAITDDQDVQTELWIRPMRQEWWLNRWIGFDPES